MTYFELPEAIDKFYSRLVRDAPPGGMLPSTDEDRRRRIVRRLITLYAMQGAEAHLTVSEALSRACREEDRQ